MATPAPAFVLYTGYDFYQPILLSEINPNTDEKTNISIDAGAGDTVDVSITNASGELTIVDWIAQSENEAGANWISGIVVLHIPAANLDQLRGHDIIGENRQLLIWIKVTKSGTSMPWRHPAYILDAPF